MGFADLEFTPSEYILLNAEKFAPQARGADAVPLLCNDGSVNGPRLAVLLVIAAILGNEADHGLELESREKKRFFRVSDGENLYIHPLSPPNWSGYTLEAAVLVLAGNLLSIKQENTLRNLVYNLMVNDSKKPWQKVVELVEWGLASSNWLIPVEGEAAAAFSIPFICPEHVRELVLAQPPEPVVELLNTCQQRRPQVWRQMISEIEGAFSDRAPD